MALYKKQKVQYMPSAAMYCKHFRYYPQIAKAYRPMNRIVSRSLRTIYQQVNAL
jgi:hypothetical protein